MDNLVSLKNIAEHCLSAANKQVKELESQITQITELESQIDFQDKMRTELKISKESKVASVEYYKGCRNAYTIMLESIELEIRIEEISHAKFMIEMEELERSNAVSFI
ncbi:MAG: hypothetical protein ACRCX2_32465 [Paraclostridium sp.]